MTDLDPDWKRHLGDPRQCPNRPPWLPLCQCCLCLPKRERRTIELTRAGEMAVALASRWP